MKKKRSRKHRSKAGFAKKKARRVTETWWTWSGSNRRPLPCHGSALPAAPQAHSYHKKPSGYYCIFAYTVPVVKPAHSSLGNQAGCVNGCDDASFHSGTRLRCQYRGLLDEL